MRSEIKKLQLSLGTLPEDEKAAFQKEMTEIYDAQITQINNPETYKIIESEGYSNMHPIWSPSGEKISLTYIYLLKGLFQAFL